MNSNATISIYVELFSNFIGRWWSKTGLLWLPSVPLVYTLTLPSTTRRTRIPIHPDVEYNQIHVLFPRRLIHQQPDSQLTIILYLSLNTPIGWLPSTLQENIPSKLFVLFQTTPRTRDQMSVPADITKIQWYVWNRPNCALNGRRGTQFMSLSDYF